MHDTSRQRRLAPLVGLLTANVVSVLGGAMSLIASPWFVFETTGSAALTGVAALCETLPVVGVSVVAGSIVRRLGARDTRAWSDVVAGVAVVSVPLLHATIGIAYWQLLVLAAINGALRTPAVAASLVMLREATVVAGLSIEQTTGLYAASVRLASTLGAPVAGALIAFIGALGVLVVDAVTFFLSAALVWWLVAPPDLQPPPEAEPEPAARTGLSTVVQGFATLRRDRVLLLLTLLAILWAVMSAGWSSVAAPIYGQGVLDSSIAMGFLLGAFGAGALLGNMSYPPLSRRFRPYTILGGALVLSGPVLWVALAAQPPLEVLIPVATLAGLGFGILPPLYLTLLYARVPTTQQGHVFGVTFALESAGQALGGAVAGLVLTYATLQTTLLGMGVVTGASTVAALRAVPLRELRHRDPSSLRRSPACKGDSAAIGQPRR